MVARAALLCFEVLTPELLLGQCPETTERLGPTARLSSGSVLSASPLEVIRLHLSMYLSPIEVTGILL